MKIFKNKKKKLPNRAFEDFSQSVSIVDGEYFSPQNVRFVVLNHNPRFLSGMPPGYQFPFPPGTKEFCFPVPDPSGQINWKRNWSKRSLKPLFYWFIIFLLIARYLDIFFLLAYLAFTYLYYVYKVLYPPFVSQVLPAFRK